MARDPPNRNIVSVIFKLFSFFVDKASQESVFLVIRRMLDGPKRFL